MVSIKRIFRIILVMVLMSILAIVVTLFWASSPNYPENEYLQLIEGDFPEATDEDSLYSIVTYNIGYLSGLTNNRAVQSSKDLFDENLITVKNALNEIDPDIICLQEIDFNSSRSYHVNQQEEIRKLGYNYTFQAVNWDVNYLPFPGTDISLHYGETYSGQSVISKYPILDPERIVLERVEDIAFYRDPFYLDRLAQVSKLILDNKEVILINVHLEAFDKNTRAKQTKHIADLYNKYKDSLPVLLVGDFNSDPGYDQATIDILMNIPGIAYADTDTEENENTFSSREPRVRIDYIFFNEAFIEMEDAKVLMSFGQASDHLPVWMEFRLK